MTDNELPYTLNIVLGDWSGDGHGATWTQVIRSSISGVVFKQHWTKTKFGPIAEEYQEPYLTEDQLAWLTAHNITGYTKDWMDVESVFHLVLKVIKVQCPKFEYALVKSEAVYGLGGYGCLGN